MRLWCGLFIAIVVAACEQLPAPTPQNADDTQPPAAFTAADSGDRLNCALLGTPPSLVPFLAGDTSAATLAGNVYQSLITYDGNLNLVPELAEKWHISPNGLTLTFTLKKGLTFTDGTPLTSRDVSATFHAIINPTTRTPYAEDYKRVAQFSTPD
ncbi:MAG: ABC transporter substrate-binding protein, partial [Pseudomonadota bacterium]